MRTALWVGLVAALALAAGLAARHWLAAETDQVMAEPLLRDLDGRIHPLAEWRGKVVVLNFWASWCTPCREEMPEFVRLQRELGDRGLQFIGIAIDEAEAIQDFLAETPVNYPILIADDTGPAWAEQLGNRLAVLPFTAVLDRTGRKVHARAGIFPREALVAVVGPLLETSVE